ncbi:MAG: putative two-component system sensor kinase [Frankiales bacterium]|nr:putative two-component system sensor kinase [Frankiales bacterium]
MRSLRLRPLPAALLLLTVLAEIAAVALSWGLEPAYDTGLYAVYAVALSAAGALVASRQPQNPLGWMFCGFALLNAVASDVAQGWALRAVQEGWAGADAGVLTSTASWLPSGLGWILTFLLFPDGKLRSRRWRPVVLVAGIGALLAVPGWCLSPARDPEFPSGHNPIASGSWVVQVLSDAGLTLFLGALVLAAASVVLRFRGSSGDLRQQMKWFAWAAAFAGVVLPVSGALWSVTPLVQVPAALALTALPVAACVAILRYRLYDIDVVVNRTLVYGVLTALLAGTYAAVVLLAGTAVDRASPAVTAVATLAVAVAFQPLRRRVQRGVDRRFNRASYDGVRQVERFLESLRAGASAPADIQAVLRDVTRDHALEVLFADAEEDQHVDVHGRGRDAAWQTRPRVRISRGGHAPGVVVFDTASPALVRDVVYAAGLALEIARLSIELRRQLSEVQASRVRIIEAGNVERRRLERDLHDGAQQRLVSIGLALRHAQHQLDDRRPDAVRATLEQGVGEIAAAIQELRELARGLPPSQLDEGVGPALREIARRAPLRVEVEVGSERFPHELEAAAYFVGCEGLTNAVKYAGAQRIVLSAQREGDQFVVSVRDDGVGGATPGTGTGLSGLADRVAALGGTLRIDSAAGAGTTVTAELPCGS